MTCRLRFLRDGAAGAMVLGGTEAVGMLLFGWKRLLKVAVWGKVLRVSLSTM